MSTPLLNRRRMMMQSGWKPFDPLPDGYVEVSGIKKTSNNGYLNLGLFGSRAAGYTFVCNISCSSGTFWWNVFFFQDTPDYSWIFQRGLFSPTRNNTAIGIGRLDLGTSLPKNDLSIQVTILRTSISFVANNQSSYGEYSDGDVGDPISKIVLQNMQGSINGHLYVYDKDKVNQRYMLRDYVPCVRTSDNQPGLFELATREFIYDTNYPSVWQTII